MICHSQIYARNLSLSDQILQPLLFTNSKFNIFILCSFFHHIPTNTKKSFNLSPLSTSLLSKLTQIHRTNPRSSILRHQMEHDKPRAPPNCFKLQNLNISVNQNFLCIPKICNIR